MANDAVHQESVSGLDPRDSAPAVAARRLLLVDDEPSILSALRRVLRRNGSYEIKTAGSGPEALDIMGAWPPDVIVTDQRMPGMSGVSFLRESLAIYPEAVRIVLSGYTELESVTSAINDGAVWKFLTKPWDDTRLCAVIEEAFRTKELFDENLRLRGSVARACEEMERANEKLTSAMEEHSAQRESARQQMEIYQEIFEATPCGLLAVGADGLIANANAAARALFGGAELFGQPLEDAMRACPCRVAQTRVALGAASIASGWLVALFIDGGQP